MGTNFQKKDLGQLFILGIAGTTLSEEEEKFIKDFQPGGIILFKNNYENPAQLAELSNKIQSLRRDYLFFIGVDQEGGRVQRFKDPFSRIPAMHTIGSIGSPKLCYEVHEIMAKQLAVCGVNMNFSPCCDVLHNPQNTVIGDRSFGDNGEHVEKYVSAAIRGLQTNGVISIAKHFPGHGSTQKDSHYDLPFIPNDLDFIKNSELLPFRKASKSRVAGILMAHLQVDAIDEDHQTTFSKKSYDFLRKELKFSGLTITDDMEMGAVVKNSSIPKACLRALNAGSDLICLRNFEEGKKSLELVYQEYDQGNLDLNSYSEKLERINKVKDEFLSKYKPVYIPQLTEVFSKPETEAFFIELAKKIDEIEKDSVS